MLSVLIVDDEPLVRSGLRAQLEAQPDIQIVGEAQHGEEAVARIRALKPALVFLDVQMPEMDGFAVLEALSDEELPAVIFVTAHDEYAIRAFDEHAVDYLLKPFDESRFARALARARSRLAEASPTQLTNLRATVGALAERSRYDSRLLVRDGGCVVVVPVEEIEWIESADNYVRVHASRGRFLLREPIKSVEARLDPRYFARAHRSAIVSLSRVRELEPLHGGEYVITLESGTRVPLSRSFRDRFRNRLVAHR